MGYGWQMRLFLWVHMNITPAQLLNELIFKPNVILKSVFRVVVTLCSDVVWYQKFGGPCYLYLVILVLI